MPVTVINVTCNGLSNGKVCIPITAIPTLPGTINILDDTATQISNLGTPSSTPPGAVIGPVTPAGVTFDTLGTYCWDGLSAGVYSVTVTDSSAPEVCTGVLTFEILEPDSLSVDYEIIPGVCGTTGVTVQGLAEGGTPSYTFTLENVGSGYGPVNKVTGLFKSVPVDPVNQYTLTVVDHKGCTENTNFLITSSGGLEAQVGVKNVTCFGACNGQISVVGLGGTPPYKILLFSDPPGSYARSSPCPENECSTSMDFDNLCAGDYRVQVTDANGCKFDYPDVITITQPTEIVYTGLVTTDPTCNDCCNGTITIDTITGGTGPYVVNITEAPEGQVIPSTIFTSGTSVAVSFTGLRAGNYTVTIKDSTGCIKTLTLGINTPPSVQFGI